MDRNDESRSEALPHRHRRARMTQALIGLSLFGISMSPASGRANDAPRDKPNADASVAARACGRPGKPACPLQAWMRARVAAPLASRNFDELAQSFEGIAKYNPDPSGWKNWDRFASEGARAARERDSRKTARACTSCHDVYRAKYNERHRERALP